MFRLDPTGHTGRPKALTVLTGPIRLAVLLLGFVGYGVLTISAGLDDLADWLDQ